MALHSHLILILLLLFSISGMANVCEIEQPETAGGNHRMAVINFPDGRRLTIVGHMHGERTDAFNLVEVKDDADLFPKIRVLIAKPKIQETLLHYREDLEILRNALRQGAEFVGVEAANEHVDTWRNVTKNFYDRVIRYSARSGDSDVGLISDAVLLLGSAPNYLTLTEPGFFLKAKLIGPEKLAIVANEAGKVKEYLAARENLLRLAADDPSNLKKFKALDVYMSSNIYVTYDPNRPHIDFQIIEQQLAKTPPKYKAAMKEYLVADLAFFKHLFARDTAVAAKLLAENKSGIHFAGAMHTLPLSRRLSDECLKLAGATSEVGPLVLRSQAAR